MKNGDIRLLEDWTVEKALANGSIELLQLLVRLFIHLSYTKVQIPINNRATLLC